MRSALLLACLLAACGGPARVPSFHLLTAADADLVVASDGSGRFRTIGDAIRQAQPGALILVRPGRYRGALSLHSGMRLVGSGPEVTIIDAAGEPAALTLEDSGSVVSGFAVVNATTGGLAVVSGRHYVERCLIAGNGESGITLSGASGIGLELDHCTIADNPLVGISLPSSPVFIHVSNSIIAFNGRAISPGLPAEADRTAFERVCLHNSDLESDRALPGKTLVIADPLFINRPHDYRLSLDSPCLDKAPHRRNIGCHP